MKRRAAGRGGRTGLPSGTLIVSCLTAGRLGIALLELQPRTTGQQKTALFPELFAHGRCPTPVICNLCRTSKPGCTLLEQAGEWFARRVPCHASCRCPRLAGNWQLQPYKWCVMAVSKAAGVDGLGRAAPDTPTPPPHAWPATIAAASTPAAGPPGHHSMDHEAPNKQASFMETSKGMGKSVVGCGMSTCAGGWPAALGGTAAAANG